MGMISSMALALWMSIGSVFYGKTSAPLPLGFSNCSFAWPPANFTMPTPKDEYVCFTQHFLVLNYITSVSMFHIAL